MCNVVHFYLIMCNVSILCSDSSTNSWYYMFLDFNLEDISTTFPILCFLKSTTIPSILKTITFEICKQSRWLRHTVRTSILLVNLFTITNTTPSVKLLITVVNLFLIQ